MRLGDNNFFNLFSRLVHKSNPGRDRDSWEVAGVRWTRERNVHWRANFSFQIEVHTLHYAARRNGWLLLAAMLAATEMWWPENREKTFRHGRWIHVCEGARTNVLKWFAERERELE